ncbi:hypothetical protein ACHAXT_012853 [Thalassiosira profunda]
MGACAAIKAGARLRRSRQWKEGQENAAANIANAPNKDNARRRRRPAKKVHDDASTGTASTAPSSDDSFSRDASPIQRTAKKPSSRRRRPKKGGKRPSIVNIVAEPTDAEKANYLALDAEMVGVGPAGCHSRLARVSLVNWEGEVVYDALVKVAEPVTDHRTFVSGITAADLESDAAVSFDEARGAVAALIEGKVVVGHGLKNDWRALGLHHPWHLTRDTAKYAPFMRAVDPSELPFGVPPTTHVPKKLKVLAKDKLGMVIQEDGRPHSPIEDAVAALELYKKHRGKWEKAVAYKVERTKAITGASL